MCHRATKTMSHSCPSPCTQEPALLSKRSHSNEKLETRETRESPHAAVKTQNRLKQINKIIKKKTETHTRDRRWEVM